MTALSLLKDLFGPAGYRHYAEALGRQPTTFHASVRSAVHEVPSPGARYEPHFRLIAKTLLALRRTRRARIAGLPRGPLARAA
jgi:hypothetical protein